MSLVHGLNHVAVMTDDLDRFIAFYTEIFELDLLFREDAEGFRHAILRLGPDAWLHPAEVRDCAHGLAGSQMFARGRLDHLALTASSPESFARVRERLVARGASEGVVEDLGAFHALWFTDRDGMRGELVLVVDARLRGFHAPRPLA